MEGWPLDAELGGILEADAVPVPDLDDAEAPLRTNRETVDNVDAIGSRLANH